MGKRNKNNIFYVHFQKVIILTQDEYHHFLNLFLFLNITILNHQSYFKISHHWRYWRVFCIVFVFFVFSFPIDYLFDMIYLANFQIFTSDRLQKNPSISFRCSNHHFHHKRFTGANAQQSRDRNFLYTVNGTQSLQVEIKQRDITLTSSGWRQN